MSNNTASWLSRLQRYVLFRHCPLCRLPLAPDDEYWCHYCVQQFPCPPYCHHCGTTTLSHVDHCGGCLSKPPPWQRLYRLGEYQPPLSQLIHQLKFSGKYWLAKPLADQLARQINDPAPLLLPVPLHPWRQWRRGYNQSHYLALDLAEALNSKTNSHCLQRIRHTAPQQSLTEQQRKHNLANAFILRPQPLPNHVAIVDDVVTTGSTVRQISKLLRKNGVSRIDIYTICHTEKP